MIITLLTIVYIICILTLSAFAIGSVTLLMTYLLHRNDKIRSNIVTDLPRAAVQLPIYNELYVVERLLKACAELDYPRDRLIIQVLDDSTDQTTELVARLVAEWREKGVDMHHIRRGSREGYKAGALAYGLELLDAEMVAVLDADFIPPPDFLKRAVSPLVNNPASPLCRGAGGISTASRTPHPRSYPRARRAFRRRTDCP